MMELQQRQCCASIHRATPDAISSTLLFRCVAEDVCFGSPTPPAPQCRVFSLSRFVFPQCGPFVRFPFFFAASSSAVFLLREHVSPLSSRLRIRIFCVSRQLLGSGERLHGAVECVLSVFVSVHSAAPIFRATFACSLRVPLVVFCSHISLSFGSVSLLSFRVTSGPVSRCGRFPLPFVSRVVPRSTEGFVVDRELRYGLGD